MSASIDTHDDVATPVEDFESHRAIIRIASALPPVERAYALARCTNLLTKLLANMNLVLPDE